MPTLNESSVKQIENRLQAAFEGFCGDDQSQLPPRVQQAIFLARVLQQRATELQTPAERRQQAELDRMMQSPGDKATLMQLTDQAFRSRVWGRAADQLIHVLDVQGVPRFFTPVERAMLRGFQSFGAYLPGVAMPLVKEKMRQETANVVLPFEPEHLRPYLAERHAEGVRVNVNHLGEALLGEREAQRRLEGYLALLQRPEIEVISVKLTTIYSQVSSLARESTLEVLEKRLERLFRAAAKETFQRPDGTKLSKLVYLDMEEYRDLHLTADVLMRTLERPGLEQARAGIALQAYIPDTLLVQQKLNAWARQRAAAGGAPITTRLVKGANMEMERVEASLTGWPQAPYQSKLDTDANYKRMLHEALRAENAAAVQVGIASHNLFTLAYGLIASAEAGALDRVQFEMLEGMAAHQRRALFELCQSMLLYAPTCLQEDFIYAIGYLVRRLDENTGEDNFLRHAFNITVDSDEWSRLEKHFVTSFEAMETAGTAPRRTQDRRVTGGNGKQEKGAPFANEHDTDWSLPHHNEWAQSILDDAKQTGVTTILVNAEGTLGRSESIRQSHDPSRPDTVVAQFHEATNDEVDRMVTVATNDPASWQQRSASERRETLDRAAEVIAQRRGPLMGTMLAEAGKLLTESDPEISEAIDFCRYYGRSAEQLMAAGTLGTGPINMGPVGVVAVVSPWNFPFAIPCGGISAALAAGNRVILKPASDTALVAYRLCECCWDAGVPREALQFCPASGSGAGAHLATHAGVDAVILTGGTATAERMLAAKPTIRLFAETGGKNATIVTSLADRDLAIKHVLHSAFSHSGQKCSATSLLILEEEVYQDTSFRDALADAVESLQVGSAWDLATKVGPLIRPPSGVLERGLKDLEQGESWLVMPRLGVEGNPHLVSPGVKWDVSPGGFTHGTEFFGPVLGVMRAKNLPDAIEIVRSTGYGLTSGLESLDDREQQQWCESVPAGNLYINRPTTGAIVQRQPFGGMGKSNVGPGLKAGGPNYVAQLMQFQAAPPGSASDGAKAEGPLANLLNSLAETQSPTELATLATAIASYEQAYGEKFSQQHDPCRLIGEDNHHRYLPAASVRVRVAEGDSLLDTALRIAAARVVGSRVIVSEPPDAHPSPLVKLIDNATHDWAGQIEFVAETDEQLAAELGGDASERLWYAHAERVPNTIRTAAAERLFWIADSPPTGVGRIDLLWLVREQTISSVYHRYGNLGTRSDEPRSPVL